MYIHFCALEVYDYLFSFSPTSEDSLSKSSSAKGFGDANKWGKTSFTSAYPEVEGIEAMEADDGDQKGNDSEQIDEIHSDGEDKINQSSVIECPDVSPLSGKASKNTKLDNDDECDSENEIPDSQAGSSTSRSVSLFSTKASETLNSYRNSPRIACTGIDGVEPLAERCIKRKSEESSTNTKKAKKREKFIVKGSGSDVQTIDVIVSCEDSPAKIKGGVSTPSKNDAKKGTPLKEHSKSSTSGTPGKITRSGRKVIAPSKDMPEPMTPPGKQSSKKSVLAGSSKDTSMQTAVSGSFPSSGEESDDGVALKANTGDKQDESKPKAKNSNADKNASPKSKVEGLLSSNAPEEDKKKSLKNIQKKITDMFSSSSPVSCDQKNKEVDEQITVGEVQVRKDKSPVCYTRKKRTSTDDSLFDQILQSGKGTSADGTESPTTNQNKVNKCDGGDKLNISNKSTTKTPRENVSNKSIISENDSMSSMTVECDSSLERDPISLDNTSFEGINLENEKDSQIEVIPFAVEDPTVKGSSVTCDKSNVNKSLQKLCPKKEKDESMTPARAKRRRSKETETADEEEDLRTRITRGRKRKIDDETESMRSTPAKRRNTRSQNDASDVALNEYVNIRKKTPKKKASLNVSMEVTEKSDSESSQNCNTEEEKEADSCISKSNDNSSDEISAKDCSTTENTLNDVVSEATEKNEFSQITEKTGVSEATEKTEVSEATEKTEVSEPTKKTAVSETTEKTEVSELTKKTAVSETTEKTAVSETTEKTAVSETTEKTAVSETTEKTEVSETTEKTEVSETTEKTEVSELTKKTAVSETTEKTEVSETTEKTEVSEVEESSCENKMDDNDTTDITVKSKNMDTDQLTDEIKGIEDDAVDESSSIDEAEEVSKDPDEKEQATEQKEVEKKLAISENNDFQHQEDDNADKYDMETEEILDTMADENNKGTESTVSDSLSNQTKSINERETNKMNVEEDSSVADESSTPKSIASLPRPSIDVHTPASTVTPERRRSTPASALRGSSSRAALMLAYAQKKNSKSRPGTPYAQHPSKRRRSDAGPLACDILDSPTRKPSLSSPCPSGSAASSTSTPPSFLRTRLSEP